ncbi:MAG TPA: hypothetical protein VHY75_09485 [Steroidobacteraceae bacterium]|jgi:hypothetical protein|nr:hypothetical protein [Steroidobacteraceae bacterium]
MSFSDETLAAYVDGELDAAAAAAIEQAMRTDPGVAQRVARYRALRGRLQEAYAPELDEPVPEHLMAALRGAEAPPSATQTRWRYALAAGVLIAVGAGFLAWRQSHPGVIESVDGTLVARGSLAEGLSNQLSGDVVPGSEVRLGLSFLAKSGDYCRTFSRLKDAGLACRRAGRWEILALTRRQPAAGADSEFRTASSVMPADILADVEQRIAGGPLDRSAEIAARSRHWDVNRPIPETP